MTDTLAFLLLWVAAGVFFCLFVRGGARGKTPRKPSKIVKISRSMDK
jgi:hypothetical protein